MNRFRRWNRKGEVDKQNTAAATVVAPLAGGADTPTTVAKVNELLGVLRNGGYIS